MCQVHEERDIASLNDEGIFRFGKGCVKCDDIAILVIGTNGSFCRKCFEKNFKHKFRASMGKNPLIRNGDKVAIALSGGSNSMSLLHLVNEGLRSDAIRKLKFVPGIIFVDETMLFPNEHLKEKVHQIKHIMAQSGFPYHIVKLEEVFSTDCANDYEKMMDVFQSASTLTAKQEILYHLRCRLLSSKAFCFGYNHVILGETSTRLSMRILSNVAIGRGVHLAQDTGFSNGGQFDDYHVKLLRPLRDITAKEVVMYNTLNEVETVFFPAFSTKLPSLSSIQNLTEKFICGLMSGFPSTEMTIYRTSNKLQAVTSNVKTEKQTIREQTNHVSKCSFCHGTMDKAVEAKGASAKDDLLYSKVICKRPLVGDLVAKGKLDGTSLFNPSANMSKICYACSIVINEVKRPGKDHLILLE